MGSPTTGEKMLLQRSDSRPFADALKFPELHLELTRAVWQVEKALKAEQELEEEKRELVSRQEGKGKTPK
jgi:hypothetical protein